MSLNSHNTWGTGLSSSFRKLPIARSASPAPPVAPAPAMANLGHNVKEPASAPAWPVCSYPQVSRKNSWMNEASAEDSRRGLRADQRCNLASSAASSAEPLKASNSSAQTDRRNAYVFESLTIKG